ncbi:MAG: ABC transporter, permease protein (cluster 13, osmolytes), partial [uncultured Solirubrobacteraceae bacterium]
EHDHGLPRRLRRGDRVHLQGARVGLGRRADRRPGRAARLRPDPPVDLGGGGRHRADRHGADRPHPRPQGQGRVPGDLDLERRPRRAVARAAGVLHRLHRRRARQRDPRAGPPGDPADPDQHLRRRPAGRPRHGRRRPRDGDDGLGDHPQGPLPARAAAHLRRHPHRERQRGRHRHHRPARQRADAGRADRDPPDLRVPGAARRRHRRRDPDHHGRHRLLPPATGAHSQGPQAGPPRAGLAPARIPCVQKGFPRHM